MLNDSALIKETQIMRVKLINSVTEYEIRFNNKIIKERDCITYKETEEICLNWGEQQTTMQISD